MLEKIFNTSFENKICLILFFFNLKFENKKFLLLLYIKKNISFNYQGSENVLTLVKLFIASITPSLYPKPESLIPPNGDISIR